MNGWVCPVCGEANSPLQNACVNGPHRRIITTSNTVTYTDSHHRNQRRGMTYRLLKLQVSL